MATQIQLRNDTAANWQSSDPVLAIGEVGINTDTNALKIGDGVSTWTELEYFTGGNSTFVPLPDFLDYVEGRGHLPNLNSNFGWNASGLWFGNAVNAGPDGGGSYPVFTNFTMAQNDGLTVEFNVDWQDECSDIGVCIYLDGDTPNWVWGTDSSRISAQFDCLVPMIKGLTTEVSDLENIIPNPGMYRVRFTYLPFGGNKVTFQLFSGTNTNNLISTLVLDEVLGDGNYRVGFASDNNGGRTYISDLSIMVNEDAPYTDTLQAGDSGSGGSADIADFVFAQSDGASTMTIHNHDMGIRTTRDDPETDADITLDSANDVWIDANDEIGLNSANGVVRVTTSGQGPNDWTFQQNGELTLPSGNASVSSGADGVYVTSSRTTTAYSDYADSTNGISGSGVYLAVTTDTQWFADNLNIANGATVTFADTTTVQTNAIYASTQGGTPVIVFGWDETGASKTFEQAFPMSIYGQTTVPNEYIQLSASDATWRFDLNGTVKFPTGPTNQRTGNAEVLQFGNGGIQSVITGPSTTSGSSTAQRLVVAGQDGYTGTTGEGGDIYLWAGRGGSAGGTGGDIKVDAGDGQGVGEGGTIKVRGGYSSSGSGGFVEIDAGSSDTGNGGNITINAGNANNGQNTNGGNVQIYSGSSNTNGYGGNIYLTTNSGGYIYLQPAADNVYVGSANPGNKVVTVAAMPYIAAAVPTLSVGQAGDHAGMVADDATHHYYCTGSYDGTTNIWKRVAWSADTWTN
jgi:hypothetical protein